VDSENKKNQQSDVWRIFQLDKGLSKAGARWSKFGSGNWRSLMPYIKLEDAIAENAHDDGGEGGREVRRILLDWYEKHYSANVMTLAVCGRGTM
jgi:insulysin